MKIYPAIDIKDGKAVRLKQGRFDDVTVFNNNPIDVAGEFYKSGASYIHMVDLDGARYGKSYILDVIKNIKSKYDILIQTGGGVRTMEDIDTRIEAGVDKVIIGTVAVRNPELVKLAVEIYGDKIAVGIDAKDGKVAIAGWEVVSDISAVVLGRKMKEYGVKEIIYTDIAKDGMMEGPNIVSTKEMIDESGAKIIASGGVRSNEDLEALETIGASGVIIGKAIYSGDIKLPEVIEKFEKGR